MSTVPPSRPRPRRPRRSPSRCPTERTHHGDTVTDPYAWLADPKDPEVIAYLEAENAYTEALDRRARRAAVRDLRRDQGAHPGDRPVGAGAQGELVAVRAHRGGPAVRDPLPPPGARRRGHPADAGGRQAAGRRGGAARRERARGRGRRSSRSARCRSAPDERLLAYSTDFAGDERYTLRIKDLVTGAVLPDEVPDTHYGCAWSRTGPRCSTSPSTRRGGPYRVWRHVVGTPAVGRRGGVRGDRREVLARRRAPAATSGTW